MELELYVFLYCVKQLSPYIFGKLFTVRANHKNLVYLSNSSIPKLVILSEYRFVIENIFQATKISSKMDSQGSILLYSIMGTSRRGMYIKMIVSRVSSG